MTNTAIHGIVVTFLIMILASVGILVMMKMKYSAEKYSVFECGFELLSLLRLPFSLNFYFVSIIFLIFDVELIMILPFIFNMKTLIIKETFILLASLFTMLIIGFIYEWVAGLLNWLI